MIVGVLGWPIGPDSPRREVAVPSIYIGHEEISCPSDLAVTTMAGQEQGAAVARELGENGEMRLEPMLPVDRKAEPIDVELPAPLLIGHAELWEHVLWHVELWHGA